MDPDILRGREDYGIQYFFFAACRGSRFVFSPSRHPTVTTVSPSARAPGGISSRSPCFTPILASGSSGPWSMTASAESAGQALEWKHTEPRVSHAPRRTSEMHRGQGRTELSAAYFGTTTTATVTGTAYKCPE